LSVLSGLKLRTGRGKSKDTKGGCVWEKRENQRDEKPAKGKRTRNKSAVYLPALAVCCTCHPKKIHMWRHLRPPVEIQFHPTDCFQLDSSRADTLLQLKHRQTRQWQTKSIARQMKSSARERKTVRTECRGQAPGKVLNDGEKGNRNLEIHFTRRKKYQCFLKENFKIIYFIFKEKVLQWRTQTNFKLCKNI